MPSPQNIKYSKSMTRQQLLEHLQDIEWDNFEVKTARTDVPKDVWETVFAFSNTSGGWIVFGVSQKKKTVDIVGVDDVEKLENDMLTTLRSKTKFNTVSKNPDSRFHRTEIIGMNEQVYQCFAQSIYFFGVFVSDSHFADCKRVVGVNSQALKQHKIVFPKIFLFFHSERVTRLGIGIVCSGNFQIINSEI